MSLSKEQIQASYPLPAYNYRVSIDGQDIGFSDVSGLDLSYEAVTYKHGLSFATGIKIIPGMPQPIKLTMKKGVVKDNAVLADWIKDTYEEPFKNFKKDILVDLCDETGKAVVRWKVLGALPVRLEAPHFDANSNDVAIETLELVALDIQLEYHPS
jgi:phage tail-like protein